jgi:hypothetical protein
VKWRKAKRADPVEAARQAETTLNVWQSRLVQILERLQKAKNMAYGNESRRIVLPSKSQRTACRPDELS